jgi:LacI family transcriptional regulator
MSGGVEVCEFPSVQPDNLEVGRIGARHFIDRGYRHLAFCGPADWSWTRRRGTAFRETALRAGCTCDLFLPAHSGGYHHRFESAARPAQTWARAGELRDWVNGLPKPVGIMGCHDQRAAHVLEACRILKIQVPQEVAVVGVDNNEMICESQYPPLTSIDLNGSRTGYEAAAMLDRLLSGLPLPERHVMIPPKEVVARMSSDILAVENETVVDALRFIQKNFDQMISVDAVARFVGISKSNLEALFRKSLGGSVGEEIRRCRLERIQVLLLDRSLNLKAIAQQVGLRSSSYLVSFFEHQTGETPRSWRRRHQTPD